MNREDPPIRPDRFRMVFFLLLVVGITILFFEMIRPFITALLLGAIFSGILQPFYRRLKGWMGGRRGLASFTTLVLFFFLLLGPLAGFLGIVTNQAVQVTESAVPWVQNVQAQLEEPGGVDRLLDRLPLADQIRPYQEQITRKAGELAQSIGEWVLQRVASITRGTVTFIFLLFVMLYAMFFFLKDGGKVLKRILYYLPLSNEDEQRMLGRFVSVTRAMVKGTFLIGIVQGALAGVAFAVAGIPSAAFWGTVMAVLSILPGIGSALVWVPAVIYLFTVGSVGPAVGLLVWCVVVVGLIDNLMRPWLVGRDTQMPDLLILLGTLGGLYLFGAAGVLIGPIVAALFITVWELYGEAFDDILPEAVLPEPPIGKPPPDPKT
jgi:predicted PurR-regulated permease PerM